MSNFTIILKEHIKRPANHFMIWSCEKRRNYLIEKNKHKNKNYAKINNSEMSKMLGREWANLPDECKLKYKKKADELKKEHKLMYPDYKYEPKLKSKMQKYKRIPRIKKNIQQNIQEHQLQKSNIYEIEYTTQGTIKKYMLYKQNIPNIPIPNIPIPNINKPNAFIKIDENICLNTYTNTTLDTDINIIMEHIFADKSNYNILSEL
jgi:hypothetical protein